MKKNIIATIIAIVILSTISIYQTIANEKSKTELAQKKLVYIANIKLNEIKYAKAETKQAIRLTHRCLAIADELTNGLNINR